MYFKKTLLLLLANVAIGTSRELVGEAALGEAKSEAPPKCGCGEDEIVFDFSNFDQHDYVNWISRNNLKVKVVGNSNRPGAQFYTPNVDEDGNELGNQPDAAVGNQGGGAARIFSSADPQPDFDLGSPNELCPGGGPGKGNAGGPGQQGENCNALGNILIIQRRKKERADDSDEGGEFTFTLDNSVNWRFIGVGTLDVPLNQQVDIYTKRWDNGEEFNSYFMGVGQNGYQEYGEAAGAPIRRHSQVRIVWPGDGGIAWLKFCRNWDDGTNEKAPDLPAGAVSAERRERQLRSGA